jgi:flavin reductase (DIM6/NTAB) family NADH-FMN oxidoreductase RutF
MPVDGDTFREAMSRWTSGVTVVTTLVDGEPHGMTASAFCSVSVDPPTILVCVSKQARTHGRIRHAGRFGVNILEESQQAWARHFAGARTRPGSVALRFQEGQSPWLEGALAFLECRVTKTCDAGTHTIFLGLVEACCVRPDGKPLAYYQRTYRQLEAIE